MNPANAGLMRCLVAVETLFGHLAKDSTQRNWLDNARSAIERAREDEAAAVARLNALNNGPEEAHMEAEAILCDFLRAQGHDAVAEAFEQAKERVGFWYS